MTLNSEQTMVIIKLEKKKACKIQLFILDFDDKLLVFEVICQKRLHLHTSYASDVEAWVKVSQRLSTI